MSFVNAPAFFICNGCRLRLDLIDFDDKRVVAGHDIRLLFSPLLLLPVAKEELLQARPLVDLKTKRALMEWTLRKHTRAHTAFFLRKSDIFFFHLHSFTTV